MSVWNFVLMVINQFFEVSSTILCFTSTFFCAVLNNFHCDNVNSSSLVTAVTSRESHIISSQLIIAKNYNSLFLFQKYSKKTVDN